ncbi:transcription factor bHLH30-like [Nymphaea colorata]|nr:transcription factor bHLH30-like [Nymphaea colorata]
MRCLPMQTDHSPPMPFSGMAQAPAVSAPGFGPYHDRNVRIPTNHLVFPSAPTFSFAAATGPEYQGIPSGCLAGPPSSSRFLGFHGGVLHDVSSGVVHPAEAVDAKAVAASRSHSEAERRRRERINTHLATLRSLLPNTTKTDKASLLAEVIRHVKELKRRTSELAEFSLVPTETDEVSVLSGEPSGDGRSVIRASFCCDDRTDILPELIRTLKTLRLRTLKAEIATLGGRMVNVLFVTGDEESGESAVGCIQEALKAVMERNGGESSTGKRQRMERRTI